MTKRMKTRIAALALFLALAASAAASDARTNAETQMGGAGQASHPDAQVMDGRSQDGGPLIIDTPYPQDHAYACSDGNCTDW